MADPAPPAPPPVGGTPPAQDQTTEQFDSPSALTTGPNQFLPWATSSTANVMPLASYTNSGGQLNGVSAGIADPTIINRAIRQGTFIAAGLAQFVANAGYTVNDDGNLPNFITNLTNSLKVSVSIPPFASNAVALTGTDTASMISPASMSYVIGQKALLLTGGSLTGNLAVAGTITSAAHTNVGALSTGSLTVSGAVVLPAASVASASLAAASAATGITNAQAAFMAANTVKANTSNAAAAPVDVAYATLLADMGVVLPTYANFQSQTSQALTANAFSARTLDHQTYNAIAGSSLSGGQIIGLPAGVYRVTASASAYASAVATILEMKLRVRNITAGTTLVSGQNTYSGASTSVADGIVANLDGVFTLAATSAIELDSWQNNNLTSAGVALGTGETDVYANLTLTKIG